MLMREQEEKGSAKMRGGEDGDGGEALAVEQGSGAEWPTRSENFEQRKGGMEEEGEREMAGKADNNNGNDSMIVSPKEICRTLARGQSLTPLLYLETMDGEIEEVERDVALLSPLVQREVHRHGRGVARTMPVVLPKQVSLSFYLTYTNTGTPRHTYTRMRVQQYLVHCCYYCSLFSEKHY